MWQRQLWSSAGRCPSSGYNWKSVPSDHLLPVFLSFLRNNNNVHVLDIGRVCVDVTSPRLCASLSSFSSLFLPFPSFSCFALFFSLKPRGTLLLFE